MPEPRDQVGGRYKIGLENLAVARPGRVLGARILFSVLRVMRSLGGFKQEMMKWEL